MSTLLTLAMLPVRVFMYVRLARTEEREALAEFGTAYDQYMHDVPAFIPRIGAPTGGPKHGSRLREVLEERKWRSSASTRSTFGTSLPH